MFIKQRTFDDVQKP